jgi:thiosulfate/3-mercaptopyruvate sulfurtransferase
MRLINVRKSDIIVVYDKIGMISAPRAFWLFKTFGLPNVMLLNGSFSKWQAENKALEEGDVESAFKRVRKTQPAEDDFKFSFNK